ncbi:hypothetical protein M405DRAFT_885086 [Rhizopogon salebrosus TDB-379]|nr:hypothetical protein M405DRAFT_885086 [Rhizopogon salebrosus TDB-379]
MSLNFDSPTSSVPKWEADWNAAESRLQAHAATLGSLDKGSLVDSNAWVVRWVSCVDQVNAARDLAKDEGHAVGVAKSEPLMKGLEFYASWKKTNDAENRLESPTKGKSLVPTMTAPVKKSVTAAAKSVSVASEDAEMVDATETTSVARDKGKGKPKVGYGDLPWPKEATSDALIFYNPKCSYCEESKGDRRCVGVKAVDRPAEKPKVITPKLKPIILVSGASDEGHTAHLTKAEADKEVREILDLYRRVYEELLAVPVIPGIKSEKEKFAGALYTTTIEGFVPASGRGIQAATSHCLGQNFSRPEMFNIVVEDPNDPSGQGKTFAWQNSWGLSTRTIGVMTMVHGDNQGLVLPPRVASVQAIVVPCGVTAKTSDEDRAKINNACDDLAKSLIDAGIRAKADLREGYTPGYKFNDWEQKGVPLRLEIGPNDLAKQQTLTVRRDTGAKAPVALADLAAMIPKMLETIQNDMFQRALAEYNSHVKEVTEWKDFVPTLDKKCVAVIPWCEREACEDDIKERSGRASTEQQDERAPSAGAKSLAIPFDQERWTPLKAGETKCVGCGQEAKRWTMFGRSY